MLITAAFSIATASGAWVMRFWLKRLNKKIRQDEDETKLAFAY